MEAGPDWRTALRSNWNSAASGPFFHLADPTSQFLEALPEENRRAAQEFSGREGFLGNTYLRLYRLRELVALNFAYEVPKLLPEVIIFGSDGCGEAFAVLLEEPTIVKVPYLPLSLELAECLAPTFSQFILRIANLGKSPDLNPDAIGKEVHDKHPICFGGSPTDPRNKVLVPVPQHAELCRFWNNAYRDAIARHQDSG
jgi:hypothetical protein